MEKPLFSTLTGRTGIDEYYKMAIDAVNHKLRVMNSAELLAVKDEELLNELRSTEWALDIVEIDPTRQPTFTPQHTRKRTLEIPLIPRESNTRVLELRGSAWPILLTPVPNFLFRKADDTLVVTVDPIESEIAKSLDFARRVMDLINAEIPNWTSAFDKAVIELIQKWKEQRTGESEHDARLDIHLHNLGIVLKKKPDAVEPVNVQLKRNVQILRTLPTTIPSPGARFVGPTALMEVIRLIDQIGKNFEVAPATYNKLEEEDLRNIIVATLNAVFDSDVATGETFSRLGKVDIRLNLPAGDILIAECKIWHGPNEYSNKNIKQLFSYLTYRHSVGMLITFVREKDLRSILKKVETAIIEHESFRSNYQEKALNWYVSNHEHPTDSEGEIQLHHLFFHLYAKDAGTT